MDQYGTGSDEELHVPDEDGSRRLDGSQSAAGDSAIDRTRAQSSRSLRHRSTRSIQSKYV